MEDKKVGLVVKTVNGKRLVFTSNGEEVKHVSLTRETQDTEFAQVGKSIVLIRVMCDTE
jgi:hypothetical protein